MKFSAIQLKTMQECNAWSSFKNKLSKSTQDEHKEIIVLAGKEAA